MPDLPSATQITDLVSLLAPGLIISGIRVRAITGSTPDLKDRLISYGVISTAYFAAIAPLFNIEGGLELPRWLWSFLQYFALPVCIGVGLAYEYQFKISYIIAEKIRLHIAHHLPASWDYKFEGLPDTTFLLVTLNDGTQIAGLWAKGSFASSSKDERDLLIAEMWDIPEGEAQWEPLTPKRSILICSKDVRHIEFLGV